MKYKHIIWDYNGTLLNDVSLCVEVINEMLSDRHVKDISLSDYRKIFDFPVRDYYEKIGFDFEKEDFEKVGKEFIDKYNLRMNYVKLHDYAKEILFNFNNNEFSQYILSARRESDLIIEAKFFGISRVFEKIVGLDNNYAAGKTENGIKLVESINAPKSEIVLIGDTTHDCEVAKEAGIDFIAVAHGHHGIERFSNCKAKVFNSLEEVEKYLITQ